MVAYILCKYVRFKKKKKKKKISRDRRSLTLLEHYSRKARILRKFIQYVQGLSCVFTKITQIHKIPPHECKFYAACS